MQMMVRFLRIIALARKRPWVRPWALSAPILVLLIALPLVRLRAPADMSDNERSRLATVQALVEHRTLAIDRTRPEFQRTADRIEKVSGFISGIEKVSGFISGRTETVSGTERVSGTVLSEQGAGVKTAYSKQPPVLSFLLSGWYWIMHRCGFTFAGRPDVVAYLLIVLGATLPVATAAGMIYRLGRLFELTRPWRAALALATVLGSGLVSYATVLNSHAPAAALILMACACIFHVAFTSRPWLRWPWLAVGGICAALAGTIDLAAPVFAGLLVLVVLALPWRWPVRLAGASCYLLGILPPLLLHAALTIPVTGDLKPGFLHPELAPRAAPQPAPLVMAMAPADDDEPDRTGPSPLAQKLRHIFDAVLGARGVISHFPIVIFGFIGMGMVLRRHWPAPTKALALVALLAALSIMAAYIVQNPDWSQPMFAVRWFIIFLPLIVFWAGAWLRKRHHPAMWAVAGVLLTFSILTSLVGATNPFIPTTQYTAYSAAKLLFHAAPPTPPVHTAVLGH